MQSYYFHYCVDFRILCIVVSQNNRLCIPISEFLAPALGEAMGNVRKVIHSKVHHCCRKRIMWMDTRRGSGEKAFAPSV